MEGGYGAIAAMSAMAARQARIDEADVSAADNQLMRF